MEPTLIITTLSKLIGLGIAVHKAHDSEGFSDDDLSALKAFLETGSSLLSRKSKDDKPVGTIQLALVAKAFGVAVGRHWAFNDRMTPGPSRLPRWVRKIWDDKKAARYDELALRLQQAGLKLQVPGEEADPVAELKMLRGLTSQPLESPYYLALWKAFSNRSLDEEGAEPLLSLEKDGDGREFERYFRHAYIEALATPDGKRVQQWHLELSGEEPRALQHALMLDLQGWGRRHVFGNSLTQAPDDVLPFMPLDDVYVEPLGRRVDERETMEAPPVPIKELITGLLKHHHLVVVRADFGHGKSLTARSMAKDLATKWIADNQATGPSLAVPVFIKCTRDIVEPSYEHTNVVRRARWNHALDALGIDRSIDDPIFEPVDQQTTLFILDGLDEISYSFNQRKELFQRLSEKARGRSRAVVFTRPGALDHGCLPKGTPVVDLLPFQNQNQITAWIEGWNRIVGPDHALQWRQIEAAGLGELARTPILLLMIAMTVKELEVDQETQQTASVDKTVLYERFFEHIARGKLAQDHGEQHRPIVEASERLRERLIAEKILAANDQPVLAMLWLMSRIAWEAHNRAYRRGETPLSVEDVNVKILKEELHLEGDVRRVIEVGLILAMQINPTGDSKDILFGHQSFREFLVARYWHHELLRLVRSPSRRRYDESITKRLREARLLHREDAAFSMLKSMLARLKGSHDDERSRIHEWAEEIVNDEELSGKSLREDRSSFLRESALAIGSSIAPMTLRDPMTLRTLLACFYGQGHSLRLIGPRLVSPGAFLGGANLTGAILDSAILCSAILHDASLFDANLNNADLSHADLANSKLIRSSLNGANLERATLLSASLHFTNLNGANLTSAGLVHAGLFRADLHGAILKDARLDFANLENANLENADLAGANLDAANLENANLENTNLFGTRYTSRTRWPNGFQPESHGAIEVKIKTALDFASRSSSENDSLAEQDDHDDVVPDPPTS